MKKWNQPGESVPELPSRRSKLLVALMVVSVLAGGAVIFWIRGPGVAGAHGDPFDVSIALADQRLRGGDLVGAISSYSEALRLRSDDRHALASRAEALTQTNEHRRAIRDLDRLVEREPDAIEHRLARARSYTELEKFSEAIQDFDTVIDADPEHLEAHMGRGHARLRSGDAAGAVADLTEAIELEPVRADLFRRRGDSRRSLGDLRGALSDYNQA
ncbi:MAG: tetratricopeptide repeat protein, partial [bacterium]|nr:tetratricopeptide repeat protein [bacterium]